MAGFKVHPAFIITAVVVVILLFKSGFMASFVTTCDNLEPDTTVAFADLLKVNLNLSQTSTAPSILYSENVSNTTNSYTFTGTAYSNKVSLNLYDTSPVNCEKVISYLLKQEVNRKTAAFIPELVRPDYNASLTYYQNTSTGYQILTTAPIVGQVYFKLVGTNYVQMSVPYNSVAPTLVADPYYFYNPIGYKTISGKIINGVAYWCSNNGHNLISASDNHFAAINVYGEGVISCATTWVNDTDTAKNQCAADFGNWNENATCICPDGEAYVALKSCATDRSTSTGTTAGSENEAETFQQEISQITTSTWIGIALAIGVIGFVIYDQFVKKKHKRR
jgi:hypothetical protein